MKKIDQETVRRILDTADIVEVVSDFVNLKKRGANYIGLCPFHNERTPSFSVSRAKGLCKCFSCGKGGSAVGFVMEHEQLSYTDALRYLARKYNIQIKEHEVSEEERQRATERESMLAVNDFAMKHFEHNLTDTADGRDIGLAYFRERGINDLMVKRFHLGYALEKSDDLLKAARAAGFTDKYLIDTGLCSQGDRGIYDRFRGRVIYPVFSVSGRVIAFGGRTLRKDKSMAKYVNSPESIIYHKSNELYGLYQAKQAIVKHDKCILVEGYMDVISMHQSGIENVVASSGTSLTQGQIRLIHRFTRNVTVIYDSDAAGIKASLRGIDLLLAEGLDIKVLSLPDGDDPDSFAQTHSSAEVEEYIRDHEIDFIRFKTNILLKDAKGDPIVKARVITDIVRSIAVIPDPVTRAVYIKECSRMLDIEERVLALQLDKSIADNADKRGQQSQRQQSYGTQPPAQPATGTEAPAPATPEGTPQPATDSGATTTPPPTIDTPTPAQPPLSRALKGAQAKMAACEREIVKYVVKYGFLPMAAEIDAEGRETGRKINVYEFVETELAADEIMLTTPLYAKIMDRVRTIAVTMWPQAAADKRVDIEQLRQRLTAEGLDDIRAKAKDMGEIEAMETMLTQDVTRRCDHEMAAFATRFLLEMLMADEDDDVRNSSADLASERYALSKVHTKYAHVETEDERLPELVPRAIMELKFNILDEQIRQINEQIRAANAAGDQAATNGLMADLFDLYQLKSQFARILGDRTVSPR